MRTARWAVAGSLIAVLQVLGPGHVDAQAVYERSLQAVRSIGTVNGFEIDYVAPRVRKVRGPQNLPETWTGPWYGQGDDYSRQSYQRYVNASLEGPQVYDAFGNSLGRNWHVYSWTQEQPTPRGSFIDKRRRFNSVRGSQGFSAYDGFFRGLVVASDVSGGGSYRLTIGDRIYSSFTPLTLYKPRFDGVRLDYAANRTSGTLLMSRPSDPDDFERTNSTTMIGGHVEVELLPGATLGATYVNAHNVLTQIEYDDGNPLRGALTGSHNTPLETIWVRVRDDSPGNGTEGVKLAGFDIVLVDTLGREFRGQDIGFGPTISGGRSSAGRLVAQNEDGIVLQYDLKDLDHEGLQTGALASVRVDVSVANDYRVEVASNLQTDSENFNPEIVFLPVARSPRNVQDNSNSRIVSVDYGLPTGNEILGVDANIVTTRLSVQGELAVNRQFRAYPNPATDSHHQMTDRAIAGYTQAVWQWQPVTLYGEVFSTDDDYTTRYWLTDARGRMTFKNPVPQVFEFVDDDDDNDAMPEWRRPFHSFNNTVWPGFDENHDFINDHNQNRNLTPDYEEPFLRYASDRPEFLFGYDMNHNDVIDRFENDDLPDYPYKADHRGYNGYVAIDLGAEAKWTVGRQNMWLLAGDGRTEAWYSTLQWAGTSPRIRPRVFLSGTLVQDDIADDLILWAQPRDAPGRMREVRDVLPALDTWKATLYGDLDSRFTNGVRLYHRAKWDIVNQRDAESDVVAREGRKVSGFLGVINKAEWVLPAGLSYFEPRFKSTFRRIRPYSRRLPTATVVEETVFLLWTQPVFAESIGVNYFPRHGRGIFDSQLQFGIEASRLWLLDGHLIDTEEDFSSISGVVQLTNRSAYQGYTLITRLGVLVTERYFETAADERSSQVFLSVNAGLR